MMKIVIIFPKGSHSLFTKSKSKSIGGAAVQMQSIAGELGRRKDLRMYSLMPNYSEKSFVKNEHFNFVNISYKKDSIFKQAFRLHAVLKKLKPDVVIQHGLTFSSCLLAKYCSFFNIKFVYMFASDIEAEGRYQGSGKKCFLFKMLLKNAHLLVTQNNYQKEVLNSFGFESHVIKNGFEIKDQISKKEKENFVLWVGRSDGMKRPELFVQLAQAIPERKFLMVCPFSSNISEKEYADLKKSVNDIENLEFLEFVEFEKIDEYFKKAKLFVNTSDYEGFPQTFVQSTMNSTPIVSLKVNPDNFLENYDCGFCAKGDFVLMQEKIKVFFENEELWNEMSSNAYGYAKENHDVKKNIDKLLDLIN